MLLPDPRIVQQGFVGRNVVERYLGGNEIQSNVTLLVFEQLHELKNERVFVPVRSNWGRA